MWRSAIAALVVGSAFTLTSAVLYAMLRMSYVEFYAPLGLRPDDVGIGASHILSDHISYLFLGLTLHNLEFVFGVAMVAVPIVFIGSFLIAVGFLSGSVSRRFGRAFATAVGFSFATAVLFELTFAIYAAWYLAPLARDKGSCAKAGWREEGFKAGLPGIPDVDVLDLRASPARITWSVPGQAGRQGFPLALLYLGTSNDHVVAWDVRNQSVIRAPKTQVIVRVLDRKHHVGRRKSPGNCP